MAKVRYIISTKNQRYGIAAVDVNTRELIMLIEDISTKKVFVENLVCKFNTYGLSILHFKDAVEDSLE